jgi:hypothetical protein
MDDYTKQALDTLIELLKADHEGFRLEAARELLKYAIATI